MLLTGIIVILTLVNTAESLTEAEAKLFTNNGCAGGEVSVQITATGVDVTTNGKPDHAWQECNPHSVGESKTTITLPLRTSKPGDNDPVYCMGGGPMGIALNGVRIYSPLTHLSKNAVDGKDQEQFDLCEGHPDQRGTYHYHKLPKCLYKPNTEMLVGIMNDGYPIYAPYENGRAITSADLDKCGGKVGSDGNYRYYFFPAGKANFPYSNGCFRAQPAQTGPAPPATECTGEMKVNHLCECGKRGAQNVIHSYESITVEGEATIRPCEEVEHDDECTTDRNNSTIVNNNNWNGNGGNSITFTFFTLGAMLLATDIIT